MILIKIRFTGKIRVILFLMILFLEKGVLAMQDTIFREYDIRGKVGSELHIDQVYDLARAIAYYFKEHDPEVTTVAIGMDGREHSEAIKNEMVRGFIESGMFVVFVGVCPSPALYFALHTISVDAGVMITASHNPKEYNGFKICLRTNSIWGKEIQVIRDMYREKKHIKPYAHGMYREFSIVRSYIGFLANRFASLKDVPLSAVVDCGNGATGAVLPQLVEKMGWQQVKLLYPEVDGSYPNHEADPVVEENMQDVKAVLATTDIQVGIGLDGDGDRMAPMTKSGYLVPGDKLLSIFAQKVVRDNPGAAVVFDIKSSAGLVEILESWGARACFSPSGHSIIKDQMKKYDALLGGELSCHFFFKDRYFGYDDGIYAMLRLFEQLVETGKTLEELLAIFPRKVSSREYRIVCDENDKCRIIQTVTDSFRIRTDTQMVTIDGVRAIMPYGWGIARASNTQSVICLRFESDSEENLERVKQDFLQALAPYFDQDVLRAQLA